MPTNENGVDLVKVRKFCRREYNKRREHEKCHPSFTACDVFALAEKRFPDLATFGAEGFCDDIGRDGVSYLNTGDMYDLTVYFVSATEQFRIGCVGDVIERGRYR